MFQVLLLAVVSAVVVFYPLYRIFHPLEVAPEQVVVEYQHRDLNVDVPVVDDLVVEHVLVDVAVLVFWNVRELVLEVLEYLVELDLLSMVALELDVSVLVELHVRVVLKVE